MGSSFSKGGHAKLQRDSTVTELTVSKFLCVSWYSRNGQNFEFKTVILRLSQGACAAIGDQPAVHEESQPVPPIKIERHTLAPIADTLAFSRENHAKQLNSVLNKEQ